jgi:hypothetical protein
MFVHKLHHKYQVLDRLTLVECRRCGLNLRLNLIGLKLHPATRVSG